NDHQILCHTAHPFIDVRQKPRLCFQFPCNLSRLAKSKSNHTPISIGLRANLLVLLDAKTFESAPPLAQSSGGTFLEAPYILFAWHLLHSTAKFQFKQRGKDLT